MRAAPQVQISTALGLDRKTIRKYLAPALAAGLTPGDGNKFDEKLRELIAAWFPEVVDPTTRTVTWPAIAAHHSWIEGKLDESVTVATIAQRLRDDHGVLVSESTVQRYIATRFADRVAASKATFPRGPVPAAPQVRRGARRLVALVLDHARRSSGGGDRRSDA